MAGVAAAPWTMEMPDIASSTYNSTALSLSAAGGITAALPPAWNQGQGAQQNMSNRRLVRVFIVDPNESVPLGRAVLHQGEEQFTDLTDQELFFELDIAKMLADHNQVRTTLVDKSRRDATVNLEPARIRDLRMLVVNIAGF